MKTFFCLLGTIFLSVTLRAQAGYSIVNHFPEGVATISQTISGNFRKMETRYGLLDEKSKQVILPVVYRAVNPAGIKEIFVVRDTAEEQGLFSIKKGFIVRPVYKEIRQFTEGYAVVVAKGKDTSRTLFG